MFHDAVCGVFMLTRQYITKEKEAQKIGRGVLNIHPSNYYEPDTFLSLFAVLSHVVLGQVSFPETAGNKSIRSFHH